MAPVGRPGSGEAMTLSNMILVFGSPRSGTTWLGKIFDSHPETLYRHEPDSVERAVHIPLLVPSEQIDALRDEALDYVARISVIRTSKVSGKAPLFTKSYNNNLTLYMKKIMIMRAKFMEKFGMPASIPDFIGHGNNKKIRLVWKSIESVGRLGLFARVLPACQAILILRHPCGHVASILRGEALGGFQSRDPASEDYGILELLLATEQASSRGLDMAAFRAMSPVERLAWRWVLFNEKAMADTATLENCQTIRYEDLCADPEVVGRSLFDFSGLSWNEQTRDFIAASTGRDSASYHSMFKNPARSVSKWRDELSGKDIESICNVARDSLPGQLFL